MARTKGRLIVRESSGGSGAGGASSRVASAYTSLTNTQPNSLTYVQYGTEEATVAQASAPVAAAVVASACCGLRAGTGASAADRGAVKLQASFDGGGSFADMSPDVVTTLASTTANHDSSTSVVGRLTGTVTGDIQVRVMIRDVDVANHIAFANGAITVTVMSS